jgi:hypothetical protein
MELKHKKKKMKNDKYFVPDIEDLCIGYELEMNWNRAYEEKWVPIKISIQDEEFTYTDEISDIVNALDDGMSEARVPYLTKEQIKNEGWKLVWNDGNDGIEVFNFEKDKWILDFSVGYSGKTNHILIGTSPTSIFFRGECKSINEFRYICKLLKI